MDRRYAAALGVAATLFGLAAAVEPGLAFDLDGAVLTIAGVLAVVQGVRYLDRRRHADRSAAAPDGEPEARVEVPVPGAAFDDDVVAARGWSPAGRHRRRELRDRVRESAVETLYRHEGLDRSAAARAVETGEWTDDRAAAAFLSPEVGVPARARVRAVLRRESTFEYALGRAVAAVAERG